MTENMEMNLDLEALEEAEGGYTRPREVPGYTIYKIVKGDTLTRIAHRFHTTIAQIMADNPKITNRNRIYAGDYLYIRK